MSNALMVPYEDRDPAEMSYPPTLPIEVALKTASVKDICESYGLSQSDWENLKRNPLFIRDLADVVSELKKDGMSFKMKARLQAEELLKTSWKLIHATNDDVSPAVKADLIKFTIRAAGLEPTKGLDSGGGNAFQINIQF